MQKYEIMADRIFCDIGIDQGLVAEYSYRVAEAFWPPSFKMCAVFKMAAMLAASVTRNANQMKSMEGSYELQLMRAKGRDAQSVTPKRIRQKRFLTQPHHARAGELMLRTLQTNLTGGAISSDAKDRLDLQVWRNSVRRAENVSIKPQGGATRRHGTTVLQQLTDSVDYLIEAFVFSQNQSYVCLFSAGRVDIWDRVTRNLVWAAAGQPWSAGMVGNREIVVVQSFDTMFVFHKDFETRQIVRTGAASFSIGTIQWGFLDTGTGQMPRMPMQKFMTGLSYMQASAITGAATLQTNVAVFQPGHVGTWFLIHQVQIYITGYISSTQANATINGTLPIPANTPTVDWQEQAFSPVRGWARCATLHEQRLFIGGGRDTPNTVWG